MQNPGPVPDLPRSIMFNAKSIIVTTKSIIFNQNFIIYNTFIIRKPGVPA